MYLLLQVLILSVCFLFYILRIVTQYCIISCATRWYICICFWSQVLDIMFFILILFISFNSSQSGFSSFKSDCFCVNTCVKIRVEMSWFFGSISFFRNKISFLRRTMWSCFHFAGMHFLVDIDSETLLW